jgi:hypothetical protein
MRNILTFLLEPEHSAGVTRKRQWPHLCRERQPVDGRGREDRFQAIAHQTTPRVEICRRVVFL